MTVQLNLWSIYKFDFCYQPFVNPFTWLSSSFLSNELRCFTYHLLFLKIFCLKYLRITIRSNNTLLLLQSICQICLMDNYLNLSLDKPFLYSLQIEKLLQQVGVCVFAILNIHPFSALSESVNVPSKLFPSSAFVIPLTC